MSIRDFVSDAEVILKPLFDLSGEILYSSIDTLVPGDLYILGHNPGGNPKSPQPHHYTVREALRRLPTRTRNAYIDESWRGAEPGSRPLQRRLCWLVQKLGYDLRRVCASNLIFVRSASVSSSGYPDNARLCWPVHESILRIVRPRVLLVFGNSPKKSPFQFLYKLLTTSPRIEQMPSGHRPWFCKAFRAEFAGQPTAVVGLPHLSRYQIEGKHHVVEWISGFLRAE